MPANPAWPARAGDGAGDAGTAPGTLNETGMPMTPAKVPGNLAV